MKLPTAIWARLGVAATLVATLVGVQAQAAEAADSYPYIIVSRDGESLCGWMGFADDGRGHLARAYAYTARVHAANTCVGPRIGTGRIAAKMMLQWYNGFEWVVCGTSNRVEYSDWTGTQTYPDRPCGNVGDFRIGATHGGQIFTDFINEDAQLPHVFSFRV